MTLTDSSLAKGLSQQASVINGPRDYDDLLDLIGDASIVLLGEATHGTQEFYRERAHITMRLITERGFNAVAIEGDWPDAYRINEYIKGERAMTASQALEGFQRFPSWMWANQEVLEFIERLHDHNEPLSETEKVGFYGLDLYSMHASMAAVVEYLDNVDRDAAARARERYACLHHFGSPQSYAYATNYRGLDACEEKVIRQLLDLRSNADRYIGSDGRSASDAYFYATQNARLVKNAEEHYRMMFSHSVSSWNLRDRHMADTLEALIDHLHQVNNRAKVIIWAHNSHIGDARATDMSARGEFNIGQLVRERYAENAINIGFMTYTGTVTAASDWDEPGQRRRVREGIAGSYERLMHEVGLPSFMMRFDRESPLMDQLREPRLERAIGVVYRPVTERMSHYFEASLPDQFNALLHFDVTNALEPLNLAEHWQVDEEPETYPFGI
ncbi:MAG TPA: erythromycin esterase family protein [Methylophilaceae bacterium]|nr:erythromycin esterase family protein [Methylophilaceae bacterium]